MKWMYQKIRGFYLALANGIPLPERGVFNFSGPGVQVTDNATQGRTDVYISGAGNVTFAAVKAALALASSTVGLNGQKLTNLGSPTTTADAATKGYVDSTASALEALTVTAGAGLTGGGAIGVEPTIDVGASDSSIVVDADGIRVGVISDAQHGARGGAELHALAVAGGDAGFMSGTQAQSLADFVSAGVPLSAIVTTGAGFAVGDVTAGDAGMIRVTAAGHPLSTGDRVLIHGVGGVADANGTFTVMVDDADNFLLDGSAFAGGPYTSGGTVLRCTNLFTVPAPDNAITEIGALRLHVFQDGVGLAAAAVRGLFGVVGSSFALRQIDDVVAPVDIDLGVLRYKITGAADDGTGRIRLEFGGAVDLWDGDSIDVGDVGGVPNADGTWTVARVDATHVDLVSSTMSGSFTSVGWATPTFRRASISGEWASGTLKIWVIGHPTESLTWTAKAYQIF